VDHIADIPDQLLGYLSHQLNEMPLFMPVTAENRDEVRGQLRAAFVQFSTEVEQRTEALMERWVEVTIGAATRLPSIDAVYVSIWDGGISVRAACKWNVELRVAFDIASIDVDGLECCEREYVELPDGTQIELDSQAETPDGIPAMAVVPEVGDVIYHLDQHGQPSETTSTITAIGPQSLHRGICRVYNDNDQPIDVVRAPGHDPADGRRAWLEYRLAG